MVKVSVVMPVYNVQQYLKEALESVCNQSITDIEIICVDDGSTDNSGRILDEYAKKDKRIKVIHKQNEGYGKAMNVGIAASTGKYVGIVESDDFIENNMYEYLYNLMEEKQLEVVKCDFYQVYMSDDGKLINEYEALSSNTELYSKKFSIYEDERAFEMVKYTWTGMYSRQFLERENIKHNETPGASYQDNGFWFQTLIKARSLYFEPKAFYHYRIDNPNASMYSTAKVFAVCDEYDFIDKIITQMGKKGSAFFKWSTFIRIRDCIYSIPRVKDEYKIPLAKRIVQDFIDALQAGYVDEKLYNDYMKKTIFKLMANPAEYIDEQKQRIERIQDVLGQYESYILYGAGIVGTRVQQLLKEGRRNTKIKAYMVSNLSGNPKIVKGIPVMTPQQLKEYRENALVIVSTASDKYSEIETIIKEEGFKNYIFADQLFKAWER